MSADMPQTWEDLARVAIDDLRRYAYDKSPERRLASAAVHDEIAAVLSMAKRTLQNATPGSTPSIHNRAPVITTARVELTEGAPIDTALEHNCKGDFILSIVSGSTPRGIVSDNKGRIFGTPERWSPHGDHPPFTRRAGDTYFYMTEFALLRLHDMMEYRREVEFIVLPANGREEPAQNGMDKLERRLLDAIHNKRGGATTVVEDRSTQWTWEVNGKLAIGKPKPFERVELNLPDGVAWGDAVRELIESAYDAGHTDGRREGWHAKRRQISEALES